MATYRSRPIEIEAVPMREVMLAIVQPRLADVPEWVTEAIKADELVALHAPDRVEVLTKEGRQSAGMDYYLIQGTEGELYPCKSSVFETKYEFVRG